MPPKRRQQGSETAAAISTKKARTRNMADDKTTTRTFKTLPITLLSGFLGSGKTTLLSYILNSPDHGLRIAMIVNDIAAVNIDQSIIKADGKKQGREAEKMISMQNGCICCTLRGDVVIELAKMAKSGDFDYVLIESTGISEPQQTAELFTADFTEALLGIDGALDQFDDDEQKIFHEIAQSGGLDKIAKLDTTVTVLDAFRFFEEFETLQLIHERFQSEVETPEDQRTVSDLMIDQIEFADVIVMNKIDMVDDDVLTRIQGLIHTMNPGAKVIQTSLKVAKNSENPYGAKPLDVKDIIGTGIYSEETSMKSSGWLRSLQDMSTIDSNGHKVVSCRPETGVSVAAIQSLVQYGINSFVYRARRPFMPNRLYELVHDKFVILEPQDEEEGEGEGGEEDRKDDSSSSGEDEEADPDAKSEVESLGSGPLKTKDGSPDDSSSGRLSPDTEETSVHSDAEDGDDSATKEFPDIDLPTRIANKKAHPAFKPLLRSKGFIWLASRPLVSGDWSQAGAMLTVSGGLNWFAVTPEEDWGAPGEDVTALIKKDFKGEWGDRRQEIVFIGESINPKEITELFNACLLNDKEMAAWENVMRREISDEAKERKLGKLFDDGWEDWPNPMMEDHEDHDHDHAGHSHAGHSHAGHKHAAHKH